jgi:acetyltransferase-like isoleucine patch superfamily enzyme
MSGKIFKLKKKILKTLARNCIWYKWRIALLRMCHFEIGQNVYIGDDLIIVEELLDKGNVIIKDRASLAPRITIVTSSHPNFSKIRPFAPVVKGKVVIEEDAWIGCGAIILPNVVVGKGAIVGAGSVVNKSVPAYTIVAGIPAKELGKVEIPPGV